MSFCGFNVTHTQNMATTLTNSFIDVVLWFQFTFIDIQLQHSNMSTWLLFLQFLAATQCYQQENFPDFDEMVADFVTQKSAALKRQVLWWDVYGNRPEIKSNPQYTKYKLTVRVCNFAYGRTATVNENPCSRNIRKLKNVNVTSGVEFLMHGTRELLSFYRWNVTKGIKINRVVNIHIPVPPLEKELAPPVWNIDIRKPINRVTVGRHKFVFDSKPYVVPYQNFVKTEFHYVTRESIVSWTAVVELEGAIAVWFRSPYQSHNLWFYPISEMANSLFQADGHCRLRYPVNGMFTWTQQLNATVKLSRFELGCDLSDIQDGELPDEVLFFIPNKLTLYGLKTVKLNYPDGKFFRNKVLMKKTQRK